MANFRTFLLASALIWAGPVSAQDNPAQAHPSPNEIVAQAPGKDWVSIAANDLLVMELAPDRDGNARQVIIQLMPPPFSQGWVANIRTLARAKWYDGISINRVQDNYVVQWGDPNHDNPASDGEAKPLPEGLNVMDESDYVTTPPSTLRGAAIVARAQDRAPFKHPAEDWNAPISGHDSYTGYTTFIEGFPVAGVQFPHHGEAWPVHCYGMVGVGRSYSPDTGSGAELYTVIGHAPRHLDRNIALVGRVIEGIEHMSSLPRGTGPLGFYTEEEADKRVPILSIRVASDLPTSDQPRFEYLSTESESFAKYAEARANRRDPFFIQPAGGADICNIPVPVRRIKPAQ
jgi:peptidylprolyl isomerase